MKLKEFNRVDMAYYTRDMPSCVNVNNVGLFHFNAAAVAKMKLKEGDQIILLNDEESPEDWYVKKVKQNGFVLRPLAESGANKKRLAFNNKTLRNKVFESANYDGKSGRILIGGAIKHDGSDFHAQIATSAKYRNY